MKRTALRSLIQSMQQNNVVEVVCDIASPGFYSHLFLVPKKSGGWRPVINLSFLNLFLKIPHFTRVQKAFDAWVTSIDHVDAYFHIPIHRGYRIFLRLQSQDTIYQFRALPFGLSPAPWVFTKIMTDIKMLVHLMGINLCQYLEQLFEPLDQASDKLLTWKTVFLIALASGICRGKIHVFECARLKRTAG